MTPKEYLEQVRKLDIEIDSRSRELDYIRDTLIKTTRIQQDKVQESHAGRYDDRYMRVIELSEKVGDKIDEVVALRLEVSDRIDKVGKYNALLRDRYLNHMTWEELAEAHHYSVSHIHRLHGQALNEFQEANSDLFNVR